MTYKLNSFETPSEVEPRETFEYSLEVCCEKSAADSLAPCDEKELKVTLKELSITGLFGIWNFPLLNKIVGSDSVRKLESTQVQLESGECTSNSREVSINRPGRYKMIVAMAGETKGERTIEVKE